MCQRNNSLVRWYCQDITSTNNKDHHVPADVKRLFEIVNGNGFDVLCQSLLDIAYDSCCRIKAGDIIPDPTTVSHGCASWMYVKSINCWFYGIFLVTYRTSWSSRIDWIIATWFENGEIGWNHYWFLENQFFSDCYLTVSLYYK